MTVSARDATGEVVSQIRTRPWGLAVAALADGDVDIALDSGDDELHEHSLFQIGSVTKTMTGLLLADACVRGETTLETTVGSILGDGAGSCAEVRLIDIATQRSGLPRLPPNLDLRSVDMRDPYAEYTNDNLLAALAAVPRPEPGTYLYSNFGFMLLGLLVAEVAGTDYAALIKDRIFDPFGMADSACGIPPAASRVPGYKGASETPWWRTRLPGHGGVACSVRDLATYLGAHLSPPPVLADAIALATAEHATEPDSMGLGWIHQGGGLWHNGATGGFRSFAAFHAPTKTAVAMLANSGDVETLDRVGFGALTEMVRSRSSQSVSHDAR